jgi:hypothetical protein
VLFMVVERFRNQDALAVYRELRAKGRHMPDGLAFVGSWVSADVGRCFQLMECDDVTLLQRGIERDVLEEVRIGPVLHVVAARLIGDRVSIGPPDLRVPADVDNPGRDGALLAAAAGVGRAVDDRGAAHAQIAAHAQRARGVEGEWRKSLDGGLDPPVSRPRVGRVVRRCPAGRGDQPLVGEADGIGTGDRDAVTAGGSVGDEDAPVVGSRHGARERRGQAAGGPRSRRRRDHALAQRPHGALKSPPRRARAPGRRPSGCGR